MTPPRAPGGPATEVTGVLLAWRRGEEHAEEELLRRIYGELRRIAAGLLRRERPEHTLQPTALVHEAYLRLSGQRGLDWRDRAHFFGLAATVMRRVLVDHARARNARKRRREDGAPVTLSVESGPEAELLDLDAALVDLAARHPRPARVVELRYFADLDIAEIATCLEVSEMTVKRDWRFARAWLRAALADRPAAP